MNEDTKKLMDRAGELADQWKAIFDRPHGQEEEMLFNTAYLNYLCEEDADYRLQCRRAFWFHNMRSRLLLIDMGFTVGDLPRIEQ